MKIEIKNVTKVFDHQEVIKKMFAYFNRGTYLWIYRTKWFW